MDNSLLYMALLSVALAISYYSWHKERDQIDLYYIWIYGIGILALIWQNVATDTLRLSGNPASINKYFLFVLWLAEAVAWVTVTIKYYQKKRT